MKYHPLREHPFENWSFPVAQLTVRDPLFRYVYNDTTNRSTDNDLYHIQDYIWLFDCESEHLYHFTFTCHAPGGPSASRTFPVDILDLDEYIPQIVIYHDERYGHYWMIN